MSCSWAGCLSPRTWAASSGLMQANNILGCLQFSTQQPRSASAFEAPTHPCSCPQSAQTDSGSAGPGAQSLRFPAPAQLLILGDSPRTHHLSANETQCPAQGEEPSLACSSQVTRSGRDVSPLEEEGMGSRSFTKSLSCSLVPGVNMPGWGWGVGVSLRGVASGISI